MYLTPTYLLFYTQLDIYVMLPKKKREGLSDIYVVIEKLKKKIVLNQYWNSLYRQETWLLGIINNYKISQEGRAQ